MLPGEFFHIDMLDTMPPSDKFREQIQAGLQVAFFMDRQSPGSPQAREILTRCARGVKRFANTPGAPQAFYLDAIANIAIAEMTFGDANRGVRLAREFLETITGLEPKYRRPLEPMCSPMHLLLARNHVNHGHRDKAVEECANAWNMLLQVTSSGEMPYPGFAATEKANIAILCSVYELHEEAIEYWEQCLGEVEKLQSQNPGEFTKFLADCYKYYGSSLVRMDRVEDAVSVGRKSLDILRPIARGTNEEARDALCHALLNLVGVNAKSASLEEQLAWGEEAVKLARKLYQGNPESYRDTLQLSLNLTATRHILSDDWEKAVTLLEQSVKLFTKTQLQWDPGEAQSLLSNYALLSRCLGRLDKKARRETIQAEFTTLLKVLMKYLPVEEGTFVVHSFLEQASEYNDTGCFPEAEMVTRVVLEYALAKKLHKTDVNLESVCLLVLLKSLIGQERFADAEPLSLRLVTIAEKLKDVPDYPGYQRLIRALDFRARILRDLKRFEEAETCLRETMPLFKIAYRKNPSHRDGEMGMISMDLADCLSRQRRFNEALETAEKGLELIKKATSGNQEPWYTTYRVATERLETIRSAQEQARIYN